MPTNYLSPLPTRKFAALYETPSQTEVLDKETEELLVPILKELKYKFRENILDHGCGTGRTGAKYFVPVAEQTLSRIYAMDHSESMIEYAKEHYAHPRVSYYETDLLDRDFPLGHIQFHKIFSIHVLCVIENWRGTLQKMYDLLKPGGILTAMTVVQSSDFFKLIKHIKTHDKWKWHGESLSIPDWILHLKDPEEIVKLALTEVGFKVNHINTHNRTHTFASIDECIELYMAAYPGPHEKNLKDPSHKHDLHNDLRDHAMDLRKDCHHNKGKKTHTVFYETLIFSAEKPRI